MNQLGPILSLVLVVGVVLWMIGWELMKVAGLWKWLVTP